MGKWLPHLGFVLVYVLWGINTSSMKIGGADWNPLVFNGLRFTLVLPVFWGLLLWLGRRVRLSLRMEGKDVALIAALGILSAVGMEALLSYALQYSTTANGSVLGRGLMPIVTAAGALLLRHASADMFRNMPDAGWISLIYTTFLASMIGFSLHNWCLGKLGPLKSAAYGYLLPITSAVGGFFLLHERLTLRQAAGGAIVLAAMYAVQRDRAKRRAPVGRAVLPQAASADESRIIESAR